MIASSSFTHEMEQDEPVERLYLNGSTCDTYVVRIFGKLHFKKKLKAEYRGMPQYVAAFHKEFEVGFCLNHPALPRYVSLTEEDGSPCIYEEFIEGETLTDFLRHNPDYFHNRRHADLFTDELLSVVAYLHNHQILYLDLKPDNVMITSVGHHLCLVDLGGCHTETFTNTEAQTEGFAAPDQKPDERTDIYLIGKVLKYAEMPSLYNELVAKCLEEKPTKRFQSVDELRRATEKARKKPRLIVLVAIALAGIISYAIAATIPNNAQPSSTQQPVATSHRLVATARSTSKAAGSTAVASANDTPLRLATQTFSKSSNAATTSPDSTSEVKQMTKELHREMDKAFNRHLATIANDSTLNATVFSRHFNPYNEAVKNIETRMIKDYPNIPPDTIHIELQKHISQTISPLMQRVLH